ncbi:MAG: dihydroorotate dehydrogenase (quinone) [Pseudomonadota bacterium]
MTNFLQYLPYAPFRSALFQLEAEKSHNFSLKMLKQLDRFRLLERIVPKYPQMPVTKFGITFPNPVGLAAGLDKNADYVSALHQLGFGFIEIGTVTPRPQEGNPYPRLFRLEKDAAIINRMGFNNLGADHVVRNLERHAFDGVLGINIGKNKDTPNENAMQDYRYGLQRFYPFADYITVNLSSPNTPGLRDLQQPKMLVPLLAELKDLSAHLKIQHGRHVPLVLKLAPDLTSQALEEIISYLIQYQWEGVIVSNTTIERPTLFSISAHETGGLSGTPLLPFANQALQAVVYAAQHRLTIIGVGGINSGASAAQKFALGADLIQVYTGLIYRGWELLPEILETISSH